MRQVSTKKQRQQAASILGSASTPAKTAAARENGKKGGRPRKPKACAQVTALFKSETKRVKAKKIPSPMTAIDIIKRRFLRSE